MARTKFLHVDEVVEILKLTKNEVYKRLASGLLKGHMQKRRWLINKDQAVFEDYNKQVGNGNRGDVDGQNNYTFGPEAEKAMKLMDEGNDLLLYLNNPT